MAQSVVAFGHDSPFSELHVTDFTIGGTRFNSIKQWMTWNKARLFGDNDSAARTLALADQAEIVAIGRRVANFNQSIWKTRQSEIVLQGVVAEFSQNPALKEALLGTGDAILAKVSAHGDPDLGIGLAAGDPRVNDPGQWKGENLLGKALMAVRMFLREPAMKRIDLSVFGAFQPEAEVVVPLLLELSTVALGYQKAVVEQPEKYKFSKGGNDVVTAFDCVLQYRVVTALSKAFPADGILGEESGEHI
jgi:ribA/ribD-fused uncharacterized protein